MTAVAHSASGLERGRFRRAASAAARTKPVTGSADGELVDMRFPCRALETLEVERSDTGALVNCEGLETVVSVRQLRQQRVRAGSVFMQRHVGATTQSAPCIEDRARGRDRR